MADVMVLQGIRQRYGGGDSPLVEVLHGIDLKLPEGGFSALIGPSGSGKSTLLNIIGLLESPTEGQLWLAGEQASGQNDRVRTALRNRYLGFIFQFHHLLPAFSAEENVLMPVLAGVGRISAADRERARTLLARVGLAEHAHKRPVQLSGGQQQRVAIVRALINRPRLVLADEPTGNLDPANGARVLALLGERIRGAGAIGILVTHSLEAAATADRVLRLDARGLHG